jgi:hypothetical protein
MMVPSDLVIMFHEAATDEGEKIKGIGPFYSLSFTVVDESCNKCKNQTLL